MTENNSSDSAHIVGEPIQESDRDKAEAERDRVSSLIGKPSEAISFYQYTDDSEVWGHRMEISTENIHVIPIDIDWIRDETNWSFIGCKNGAVMFEGVLPEKPSMEIPQRSSMDAETYIEPAFSSD